MHCYAWLKITGRVQGVFYRQSTRQEAQTLGLLGWVRNVSDGSVEALVAGSEPAINALIDWCQDGPPSAVVQNVEVKWLSPDKFSSFGLSEYEVKFRDNFEIR